MEPCLKKNDKDMFYKYLNKSKIYFEYGSGGSTYQASIRNNITRIYSVESDKEWFNLLQNKIKSNNITYFYNYPFIIDIIILSLSFSYEVCFIPTLFSERASKHIIG